MAAGPQVEHLVDRLGDGVRVDLLGTEGLDQHRHRAGHADGVGHLDLAAAGGPGGHHVLGHPAGRVGGGAVDLGRVLAREGAATVAGHAAVGVDDDLAAGETGVGVGAAQLEHAGRIGQHPQVRRVELGRQQRVDDVGPQVGQEQGLEVDARVVLGRDQDRLEGDRPAVLVGDAHLGLAVGAQVRQRADPADLGQALGQAVGQPDRQRHEVRASRRRRSRTSSPGRRRPGR